MNNGRGSGTAVLIVLGLILAGCATTMDPTTPTADISGRWEGIWRYPAFALHGSLALSLTQNGTGVTGNIDSEVYSLSVTGTIYGNSFLFVSPGTSLSGTLLVRHDQLLGEFTSPRNPPQQLNAKLTRKN